MDKLRTRPPAVRLVLERVHPKIVTRPSQDGLSASLIFKVPHYRTLLLVPFVVQITWTRQLASKPRRGEGLVFAV